MPQIFAPLPAAIGRNFQDAKFEDEICNILSDIATSMGFSCHIYSGRFTIDNHENITKFLSNVLPVGTAAPINAHDRISKLIGQQARGRLTPFIWGKTDRATHLGPVQQELSAEARLIGLEEGVSYPIHDGMGDFGVLSFSGPSNLFDQPEYFHRLLADGLLVAVFAHDAMKRVVNKSARILEKPLTARETECLRLIAIGKSTWEMSKILGLSEHGVLHHVRHLMAKFGVHQRHQAVIRATACGLL